MESNVEVALAAKLALLFPPTDDTFLAFPLAGAAFTQDDLAIFESEDESAEQVRQRGLHSSQFARMVNQVPRDSVIFEPTGTLLWDQYEAVLARAVMARSVLTPAERKRLDDARDFLMDVVDVEGVRTSVYSPELTAYYRYKEEYEDFERTYLDEKVTAELASDEAVRSAWENARRPELEAGRTRAMQDWLTLGHKDDVEAAQAAVLALTGRDPEVRRVQLLADLRACNEPDLATQDANGVFTTFYSPSDTFDPDVAWTRLHLTREETGTLMEAAPPELKARATGTASAIRAVTVEYANVAVLRPWFDPGFFAMSSWRLPPDDTEPVSDGKVPRGGRIPAFITSMIVVRRLIVERDAVAPREGAARDLALLARAAQRLDRTWAVAAPDGGRRQIRMAARQAPPPSPAAPAPTVSPPVLRGRAGRVAALGATVRRVRPASAARPGGATTTATPPPVRATAGDLRSSPRVRAVRDHRSGSGRPVVRDHRTGGGGPVVRDHRTGRVPVPEPAPGPEVDEIIFDGAVVLAFRCRRVVEAPRPDLTLDWGEAGPAPTPFPLPDGHAFGPARDVLGIHSGHADADDRAFVRQVQQRLVDRGEPIAVDGYYGAQTAGAVRAFQGRAGLEIDGLVGPRTWEALWRPQH